MRLWEGEVETKSAAALKTVDVGRKGDLTPLSRGDLLPTTLSPSNLPLPLLPPPNASSKYGASTVSPQTDALQPRRERNLRGFPPAQGGRGIHSSQEQFPCCLPAPPPSPSLAWLSGCVLRSGTEQSYAWSSCVGLSSMAARLPSTCPSADPGTGCSPCPPCLPCHSPQLPQPFGN